MAGRPIKTRLDYFPLEVDYFTDRKFKKIRSEFGFEGEGMVLRVLNEIYKNGYFLEYDDGLAVDIADGTGVKAETSARIMEAMADCGLLDSDMYYIDGVLTSKGIQRRWLVACEKRKKPELRYWLLDVKADTDGESVFDDAVNEFFGYGNDANEMKGKEMKIEDEEERACMREAQKCLDEYKKQYGVMRHEEKMYLIEMVYVYGESMVLAAIKKAAVHGVTHVMPYIEETLAEDDCEIRRSRGEENVMHVKYRRPL